MAGSFQSKTCQTIPFNCLSLASCITRSNNIFPIPLLRLSLETMMSSKYNFCPCQVENWIKYKAHPKIIVFLPKGVVSSATNAHHTGLFPNPLSVKCSKVIVTSSEDFHIQPIPLPTLTE